MQEENRFDQGKKSRISTYSNEKIDQPEGNSSHK